jgi:hypothetical protein
MSKKKEEEINEEIKETIEKEDTLVMDDSNVDAETEVTEEIQEGSTEGTKVDVVEETMDVEQSKIEEPTELADPFSNWADVFEEFHKDMPPKSPIENSVWLTRDEIQMVAREEIKGWVKGVQDGKYPMPTGLIETVDSTLTEVAASFPEKEFKSVQDDIVEIKKSKEDATTRLDGIMKSLDAMKKEIEVIRDAPIEVIEKSIIKDTSYESKIDISRDGHISKRK